MTTRRAATVLTLLSAAGSAAAQDCVWSQIPQVGDWPSPRYYAAMAYDSARARVVLFGGKNGYGGPRLNDTWEWDGTSWTLKATTGPSPRFKHNMAYHAGLARTIMFAGDMANPQDAHTWQWDGTQWTMMPGDNFDFLPIGAAIAYDQAHQRMIMYGGYLSSVGGQTVTRELGPTGVWFITAIPTPPFRFFPSFAYNPDRGRLMLYGGAPYYTTDEVWEFDGAAGPGSGSWTFVGHGPAARETSPMVYDTARHRMVLVGGSPTSFTNLTDAWEYDGTTWTRRADDGPIPRDGAAMVYDAARSSVLFFGGGESNPRNDLWRFDGSHTQAIVVQSTAQDPPGLILSGNPGSITVNATGVTSYQWFKDNVPLTNSGLYSGVTTPTLWVSSLTQTNNVFRLTMTGTCWTLDKNVYFPVTDPLGCYPNCDRSTVLPYLTANDFQCFINNFAARTSYGNCDGSTNPPTINANDFQCFLGWYAAGCN